MKGVGLIDLTRNRIIRPTFVYLLSTHFIKSILLNWSDTEIIRSIKDGHDAGLVHLYSSLREEFILWGVKRFQVDRDLISDAFQEAIIALRHNVIGDRLNQLKSSLKTYLFAIGRNQILNRLKKSKYELSAEDFKSLKHEHLTIKGEKEDLTDRQESVRAFIKQMKEPCKSILRMYYYLGFSMEVIASRMSYKNENVAKSQKMRCLKKLKNALGAGT